MNLFTHIILLILVVTYLVANAIINARKQKKRIESGTTSESRIDRFKRGIMKDMIYTVIALLIVIFSSISFYDIGFRAVSFSYNLWFTVITFIMCGALLINSFHQMIMPLLSAKYRQKIKEISNKDKLLGSSLPRNKKERLWWVGRSMSAGISEEILCRGFFFYLLFAIFPGVSPIIVVISTSAIFGFAHLYQGIKGIMMTALGGALAGCLYLVTDSLLSVMLLHFFVDLAIVFLLSDD